MKAKSQIQGMQLIAKTTLAEAIAAVTARLAAESRLQWRLG